MNYFKIIFLTTMLCCITSASFAAEKKDFELIDALSQRHVLSSYHGKWVIVNYWATWCPPCLEEVPDLVTLYDARKDRDVMVIGVAWEYKSKQEVLAFADDMLMSYPIVLGDAYVMKQIGSAEVLPTTFIYNPRGELVKVKRGLVSKAYLESVMQSGGAKPKP